MEEQKFTLIKEIYKPSDSSITFMLPILICVVTGIITVYYIIQIELNSSKLDWSKNKCLPKSRYQHMLPKTFGRFSRSLS